MAPYQENLAGQMPDNSNSPGLPWRLFIFILIIFSISLFGYIGLEFGYKPSLISNAASLQTEIDSLASELDLGKQKDLLAFYSQIVNSKSLLKSHVFASKIFPFIQDYTSKNIVYSTMNLDIAERQLRLDGLASNYDVLVQQLLKWQNSPEIEKVLLQDNSVAENFIRFSATLTFKPDFFIFSTIAPTQGEQTGGSNNSGNTPTSN